MRLGLVGLQFIPETKLKTLFRTVMNIGGAAARQYELVGTQKENKALLLGTQLHAFGEVATTRNVCPVPHTLCLGCSGQTVSDAHCLAACTHPAHELSSVTPFAAV